MAGPLAAWATAWLAGTSSSDEVLSAVALDGGAQHVHGLDGSDAAVPLSRALIEWRLRRNVVRLILPVPGDVRGVPGPAAFRTAALEAGQAAYGGGLGLVPHVPEHHLSSAPPPVRWQAYQVAAAPEDLLSVADAQHDLAEAIRDCAGALADATTARWTDETAHGLALARRAGESVNLPPGYPPRAVQLIAQAQRLQAVVALAEANPTGDAVDRRGVAVRAAALQPLATAVRRALLAGYNALAGDG
jgi:hypothetical protein